MDTWERFNESVANHDEQLCQEIKDEISFLMVVAGLFLAIVIAFMIESNKLLQEDKQDTIAELLVEVVRLLNDTSTQGHAKLPKHFVPDHRHVVVNHLWFLSLSLSLVAVMIGTFCLQWISAFLQGVDLNSRSTSPQSSLGMRQLRYAGMIGWGVRYAPGTLLLIVQLSIMLFVLGYLYYLIAVIDPIIAVPGILVTSISTVLIGFANVMPFVQSLVGVFFPATLAMPPCPYKSPISWLVRTGGEIVVCALRPFTSWLQHRGKTAERLAEWLQNQPLPLTDYLWRKHDLMWAKLRESWSTYSREWYVGMGISSAIDIVVLERDAMNVIRHSLKTLPSRFLTAEHWKNIFHQSLTTTEAEFLKPGINCTIDLAFAPHHLPEGDEDGQRAYLEEIKIDFLHALALQNLILRSAKLQRTWLLYRVELYIRIKNSSGFIVNHPSTVARSIHEFGSSLAFPLQDLHEILLLDSGGVISIIKRCIDPEIYIELKFQFLNCVERFPMKAITGRPNLWPLRISSTSSIKKSRKSYAPQDKIAAELSGRDGAKLQWNVDRATRTLGGKKVEHLFRDSFSQLCNRMKEQLLTIPRSNFSDDTKFCRIQDVLYNCRSPWISKTFYLNTEQTLGP